MMDQQSSASDQEPVRRFNFTHENFKCHLKVLLCCCPPAGARAVSEMWLLLWKLRKGQLTVDYTFDILIRELHCFCIPRGRKTQRNIQPNFIYFFFFCQVQGSRCSPSVQEPFSSNGPTISLQPKNVI